MIEWPKMLLAGFVSLLIFSGGFGTGFNYGTSATPPKIIEKIVTVHENQTIYELADSTNPFDEFCRIYNCNNYALNVKTTFKLRTPDCRNIQKYAENITLCEVPEILYVDVTNSSNVLKANGAMFQETEFTPINGTTQVRKIYHIYIVDSLDEPIYNATLMHELCHVRQYQENRNRDENECFRESGIGDILWQ